MKVVLFCGGLGTRLREYTETIPKPLVTIGDQPILWHLMKYYAHFGHTDFILCLGWKADAIKEYFLNYNECLSNDFTISNGGRDVKLLNQDIADWNITFVDTGLKSCIGQRLMAVKKFVQDEETFLANYTDGVCDVDLNQLTELHQQKNSVATFLSVLPSQTFHTVDMDEDGTVKSIRDAQAKKLWINGGYFVLSNKIFDYMNPGEELVEQPFERLVPEKKLTTVRHPGFWACMDTYKEMQQLHEMYNHGDTPWMLWNKKTDENKQLCENTGN